MRGYGMHLLFHLLAMLAGGVGGVALGMWWTETVPSAIWLAVAAFAAGVVVVALQALYVTAKTPPRRARRSASKAAVRRSAARETPPGESDARRGGTRPQVSAPDPDTAARSGGTRVQSALRPETSDEDTRHSASEALQDEWRSR